MKLMYLSNAAIDDIKTNYSTYKNHFTDESNEWFMDRFEKNGWIHESKIQCTDFELNYDETYSVSDRKNVEIVYEALKDLNPVNAADERLWAGMLFGQFWKYVRYRRAKELESGDERDVLNSFLFMRGKKRSCFMNCLSRLWWTGYILYDKSNTNHYSAVDTICESAYASTLILFSSNNFVSNREIGLGVIDCISERKKNGEKIGRYHLVEANKYLNCVGGITLLDSLTRNEVKNMVDKQLTKLFP